MLSSTSGIGVSVEIKIVSVQTWARYDASEKPNINLV